MARKLEYDSPARRVTGGIWAAWRGAMFWFLLFALLLMSVVMAFGFVLHRLYPEAAL